MREINAKKQTVGFGLLALSFVFFFNPNINIIDVLPDCIGYTLLCAALTKLSHLNESIEEAVSLFRKMILVDAGKWLAVLWVFGMSVTSERNSSLLLWSFVFSFLEILLLVPAYSKLFYGITQIGYRYSETSIFGKSEGTRRKSATDKMRSLTVVFVCLKSVLSVLPEFADLSNTSYDESSSLVNLYQYIGIMRFLASIPVVLVGLIWLTAIIRYTLRLRGDTVLVGELCERYDREVLPKTGMFVRRNFHAVYGILLLSLCLTVDFRLESQNYIPDYLAAICFFVAFVFLQKYTKIKKSSWMISCVSYLGLTIASAVLDYRFFAEYYYGAIIKNEKAMMAYSFLIACNVLKAILFLIVMWVLITALKATVRQHTGYVAGKEAAGENERKMVQGIHNDLWRSLLCSFFTAIAYVISDLAYDLLAPTYGFMGVINLLFAVICIGAFLKTLTRIQEAVNTKYMLE